MSNGDYSGENYDQVVYYVAPGVLVSAILFCCFRMALVYYMQIRPRRNQTSTVHASSTRESEIQSRMNSIPAACRDIFMETPFPPSYQQTLKNDRRSMSAIETSTAQDPTRRPTEIIVQVTQNDTPDQQETSGRPTTTRDGIRRAQSNVEVIPPANLGPPAYSQRLSDEDLDSEMLSAESSARLRLPSYEEAILEPESRRPTLNV